MSLAVSLPGSVVPGALVTAWPAQRGTSDRLSAGCCRRLEVANVGVNPPAPVAQWIEQPVSTRSVGGSSPSGRT